MCDKISLFSKLNPKFFPLERTAIMFRQLFSSHQNKFDLWKEPKIEVPKQGQEICSASLRGMTDGLIMGFVIGGVLGIMQGWVSDAKTKDMCMLSSSWALNGAAIGAVALAVGNTILNADMTPGVYAVR